jgi:predicted nucleic acid-binding protein
MSWYLLDTNHLSEAIRPISLLRERLRRARLDGHVFGLCVPVLCELEAGIVQTADPADYRRRLRRSMSLFRLWPLDATVARIYGEYFISLRRRGRALSQVDIMVAALCRHMDLTLLSTDSDFDSLPDIHRENWLAPTAASNS